MALIDSIYIKTLKVKPAVSQIFNKKNFNNNRRILYESSRNGFLKDIEPPLFFSSIQPQHAVARLIFITSVNNYRNKGYIIKIADKYKQV